MFDNSKFYFCGILSTPSTLSVNTNPLPLICYLLHVGKSLLERLMEKEDGPYRPQRDITPKYDPNYVTKLVNSFRSHPDIFEIPNQLFYDGELEAHANITARNKFCNWEVNSFIWSCASTCVELTISKIAFDQYYKIELVFLLFLLFFFDRILIHLS